MKTKNRDVAHKFRVSAAGRPVNKGACAKRARPGGNMLLGSVLTILSLLALAQPAWAISPRCVNSSEVTTTVDGDISEWNIAIPGDDFLSEMWEAFNPDKRILSNAYARYDTASNTMYVLVLAQDSSQFPIDKSGDHWVAVNGFANKLVQESDGNDGTPPDFAYVELDPASADYARGWEASFFLPNPADNITIHTNVYDVDETVTPTSATEKDTPLEVLCSNPEITTQCQDLTTGEDEYTLEYLVENLGSDTATNLRFELQLNSNLKYVSGSSNPASTCSAASGEPGELVTCTLDQANLDPNEIWTIKIVVDVVTVGPGPSIVGTVYSDNDSFTGNNEAGCSGSTPVTLSFFEAKEEGGQVVFDWTTIDETSNVGFNLYVETDSGRVRLNDTIIESHNGDSDLPQSYRFAADNLGGDTFYLVDLSTSGIKASHGPFALGESHGAEPVISVTNWGKVRSENAVLKSAKKQLFKKRLKKALKVQGRKARELAEKTGQQTVELYGTTVLASDALTPGLSTDTIALLVEDGAIHRVTFADLQAEIGVDLSRKTMRDLSLHNAGKSVPFRLVSGNGGYIEFVANGIDSLYTGSNPYLLKIGHGRGTQAGSNVDGLPEDFQPAAFYMETIQVEQLPGKKPRYDLSARSDDPWAADRLVAIGKPLQRSYDDVLVVDNYIPGVAPATLAVNLWGETTFPSAPDHHVVVSMNGTEMDERLFDGLTAQTLGGMVPEGGLREGGNTVTLSLPFNFDPESIWYDVVQLDDISLTFPRAFVARDGVLTFRAKGSGFAVDGLPSADVVVYRVRDNGQVQKLTPEVEPAAGSFRASFVGNGSPATYYVASASALAKPAIEPAAQPVDCAQGEEARYLVVAHDNFINEDLDALVQAREAEGYTADVVPVDGLYARYTHGVVDPAAIRACVSDAVINRGTEAVLLVGATNYDPTDKLDNGAVSFLPTMYRRTDEVVSHAPVDAALADIDLDAIPDVAIGRFPVRTLDELRLMVSKTLDYGSSGSGGRAVFAADQFFESDSDAILGELPDGWYVLKAYVRNDVSSAQTVLIDALDAEPGVALVGYVGHSSWLSWTSKGLFGMDEAEALTNTASPTVVVQWGCWNTYFASPKAATLADSLLSAGPQGAAAVMGASTLTKASHERELGVRLFAEAGMANGYTTIGAALLAAKQSLANDHPEWVDILLGYQLLGDPLLVVDDVAF